MLVDVESVQKTTAELLERVSSLPGMKEFIDKVNSSGTFYDPGVACVNGSVETNLGLLRAYMCNYLLNHPLIGKNQQILVRVMDSGPNGIPLQIYCYTTTAWTAYEAVQSEIFEHLTVIAPIFGLQMFGNPTGEDVNKMLASKSDQIAQPTSST